MPRDGNGRMDFGQSGGNLIWIWGSRVAMSSEELDKIRIRKSVICLNLREEMIIHNFWRKIPI